MYTSRAAGAQVRKVTPPGARFAPSGVFRVMFSCDAGIGDPQFTVRKIVAPQSAQLSLKSFGWDTGDSDDGLVSSERR
jgi:hypothetical protein